LHNLTWDASRKRWTLRLTVDVGKNVCGKRFVGLMKTACPQTAIIAREVFLELCKQFKIPVITRLIKRK